MKLSEMPTKKAAACMAELAAPIGEIAKNPKVYEWVKGNAGKKVDYSLAVGFIADMLSVLLRDQYDEVTKVISVLTGKPAEEIDKQPISATIADVKGCMDGDLIGFFT